jgi:hypothetical protein
MVEAAVARFLLSSMPSAGRRELHLLGVLDDPRGAQDLEADDATVLGEVGDDAWSHPLCAALRGEPAVAPRASFAQTDEDSP